MRLAAIEQAAVVEEDVHQLPEHVVERLDQLLAHEGVGGRWLEVPLGGASFEGDRHAAAIARLARGQTASAASAPKPMTMSSGSATRSTCSVGRPALRPKADRRQRSLADDRRMDELDSHVAHV